MCVALKNEVTDEWCETHPMYDGYCACDGGDEDTSAPAGKGTGAAEGTECIDATGTPESCQNAATAERQQAPPPPLPVLHDKVEFIVIVASVRSASTSIAEAVANNRCSISFNEFFSHRGDQFSTDRRRNTFLPEGVSESARGCLYADRGCRMMPRKCDGPLWTQRRTFMLSALKAGREAFCRRSHGAGESPGAGCDGRCVVAVKLFRGHIESEASLRDLLAYNGTRVVMDERDADDVQCSLNYSQAMHQWHTNDYDQERMWKSRHCQPHASPEFAAGHREWFVSVRRILDQLGKVPLEMPFNEFVANTSRAGTRLRKFAHLPETVGNLSFEQPWCTAYDAPVAPAVPAVRAAPLPSPSPWPSPWPSSSPSHAGS